MRRDELALTAARSQHPNGVMVLLRYGSVRFASDSIELSIWRALATRQSVEVIHDW